MKLLFFIICLLFIFINFTYASEITGKISTNIGEQINSDKSNQNINIQKEYARSIHELTETSSKDSGKKDLLSASGQQVKVLGIEYQKNGALLRDEMGRIYIIFGNTKKHIKSLKELQKYKGIEIIDVNRAVIDGYIDRQYTPGNLIREIGKEKIFVVLSSGKKYVKNLKELHDNFRGLEIFSVTNQELSLY